MVNILTMNLNWIDDNLIYLTLHGSRAYGLSTELSDTDVKGICIPPTSVENNLFHKFEQAENSQVVESHFGHLRNPKNPKLESTIFSLKKFFVLAANVNPNIIELLWTDPEDHKLSTPAFVELLDNRQLFLSSKAKFTFSGYAFAQAAKIERHRKWILEGELKQPLRSDFNLPEVSARGFDEVNKYVKQKMEVWNLSQFSIDEMARNDLKETIWEIITEVSGAAVSWDNWPEAYWISAQNKLVHDLGLSEDVARLIQAEYAFKRADEKYKSWLTWKTNRNPERFRLEEKSGYDTKHASHLVRLMRMGYEILTENRVVVKRPDREELLSVKNGGWTYDKVMEYAETMQKKLDDAYLKTKLPKSCDFEKINGLYHRLYSTYAR
jgi:predicted nucleotidyltransferase